MKKTLVLMSLLLAGCQQVSQVSPIEKTPSQLVAFQFQAGEANTQKQSVQPLAIQEVSGLAFQQLSTSTFTVKQKGVRYLSTTYRVTNQSGRTLKDLAFVGVNLDDTDGDPSNNSMQPTAGNTAFAKVKLYDGTDASGKASSMVPGHLYTYDPQNDRAIFEARGTAFARGLSVPDFDPVPPEGLALNKLDFGWVLYGDFENNTSRTVTFSTQLPLSANAKDDPFSFSFIAAFAELNRSQNVQFQSPTQLNFGSTVSKVATGDFNEDGYPDLVVTRNNANSVYILLNDTTGHFPTITTASTPWPMYLVVPAFVNADPHQDLLLANYDRGVRILLGNGDGTFEDGDGVALDTGLMDLQVADLNGDAYPDILGLTMNALIVQMSNAGGPILPPQQRYTSVEPFSMLSAGNLNGDNHADVVIAGPTNQLFVLNNNGDGTLNAPTAYQSSFSPSGIVVTDLNGEPGDDVAVSALYGANISVHPGDGNGQLFPFAQSAAGRLFGDLTHADFNGDGLTDLATSVFSTSLQVNLNDGNGNFPESVSVPISGFVKDLSSADLNGDGKVDLVGLIPDDDALVVVLQE